MVENNLGFLGRERKVIVYCGAWRLLAVYSAMRAKLGFGRDILNGLRFRRQPTCA